MNSNQQVEYQISKSLAVLMFVAFILVGVFAPSVCAQGTLGGPFVLGPGTVNASSDAVTFNAPARTTVSVLVLLQRDISARNGVPVLRDVAMTIDVIKPDGSLAISQPATASVINAAVPVPVITVPGLFSSQRGCPSTWRVRVHTANDIAPPVRVFGTITYGFVLPGKVNLDMEGEATNVNSGATVNKTLAGHNLSGAADRTLIAGTGTIRIKGKWHTDPLDLIHFNQFFSLTVSLLRPNGTVADSETGFSQHAPAPFGPKLDFSYTVTAQDALLTGAWTLRIRSAAGTPKIVSFDIERGLDVNSPSFNSTFLAACTTAVGVN